MRAEYSVVWLPTAEEQLADAWLNARDREQIRQLADAMEIALSQMPNIVGEEVLSGKRVARFGLLVILFAVSDDDRLVTVLRLLVAPI